MKRYKIYSKTMRLLGLSNDQMYTLNNKSYRLLINRTACIYLFLSLVSNVLPKIPNSFEGNGVFSTNTNNVLFDSNIKNKRDLGNIENSIALVFKGLEPITYDSMIPPSLGDNWSLKSTYIEDIYQFINKESLSMDGFIKLLDSMTSDNGPFGKLYEDNKSAIDALLVENKSYEVKFLIVMARDSYTYDNLDYMCAGITGESTGGGHCYDDAYAVASTLINRSHTLWYVNNYGHDFYNIFTAPGQYEIELSGNYLKYLGAIHLEGYQAAVDAFYTRQSIHKWLQFRARWVELDCTYETFVEGGNKYIDKMEDYEYVPYPGEEVSLSDVKTFVFSMNNN